MNRILPLFAIPVILCFLSFSGWSQNVNQRRFPQHVYPAATRANDSVMLSQVPLLEVPESQLKAALPSEVDNSTTDFWPGLLDQMQFYSCQQYSGVAYTFGYEYSRLMSQTGWYWENRFPAHYTWNFINKGDRWAGGNFLQSFNIIRQQGHMTCQYYGADTAGFYLGWASGYDKYYSGMRHRLKKVSALAINSATGVNTLRNYLYNHLDGSPVGGIACFITESWFNNYPLPQGTPEAGKNVQVFWYSLPDHGLCIVGYNDSIRYDVNGDGQYTNNIDINNDGVVDVKDWEIGAFKFANSWGSWWDDGGYCYVLYRAMGSNFEDGGVWNNKVFIVQADTGYRPMLTMKVKVDYNKRQRIRLVAGVSSNVSAVAPEHTISFPIVNFQGGDNVMSGFNENPGSNAVELGLDITPLLNYFPATGTARLFFGVEERDPDHTGNGTIQTASFLSYAGGLPQEFTATSSPVNIVDNNLTLVSAVANVTTSRVQITTTDLPPYTPGQNYEVQLAASGGKAPYNWTIHQNYSKQPFTAAVPSNNGVQLSKISDLRPYAVKTMPFTFTYYGKTYNNIYINFNGFVSFEPIALPAPYTTDEIAMLQMFPLISPAFSQYFTYIPSKNDGVFYYADANSVVIWWKASVLGYESTSSNNFALIIYPDGHFEYRYGAMNDGPILPTIYTGISKGDNQDYEVEAQWRADTLTGHATRYLFSPAPPKCSLSAGGLLAVSLTDTTQIYSVPVRVTDEENQFDSRLLTLSTGLSINQEVVCGEDGEFRYGVPAHLKLTLINTGSAIMNNLEIRLKSMDNACLVSDSLVNVPVLNPGETLVLPQVFTFALTQRLPGGYPVRVALHAQKDSRLWHKIIDIPVSVVVHQAQVDFQSFVINDADGKLSTGETANLDMTMINLGDQPASNVNVILSCSSPFITLIDTLAYFGNFNSGEIRTIENAFTIQAANNIPDGPPITFTLTATDGTATWTSTFNINPAAPAFSIGGMVVNEVPPPTAPGNTSGVLDPGDIADLVVATTNSGGFHAASTTGELACSSAYITINTGSYTFGDIAAGETQHATFNVTVSPDAPLNTPVTFTYTVTSGLYIAQKQFVKVIGLVVEDFETGDFSRFPWTFGGNKPWVITNIGPFEGIYSIKSGFITDNLYSDLLLQRNVTRPDTISFYLKTSSEAGYDFLKFFIDDVNVGQWSGETPWTRAAFPVSVGNHNFKWQYIKDNGVSSGSDCGWIDWVGLPSDVPVGVSVSGTISYANTAGTPLAGLSINLKNSVGAVVQTTTTNNSGFYTFSAVPPGGYSFDVSTSKPWGGVTAADALLYRKHIANISPLTGIYLASGDVNSSGSLTAADVLLVKKRIGAIISAFPSGDWLFNHSLFTVGTSNVTQNFNGITYGDANGSYIPSGAKSLVPRQGVVALGSVSGGKHEVVLPIHLSGLENLGSFQFSVQYDANKLKIIELTDWNPMLEEVTAGTQTPGIITFVWAAGANGVSISDGLLCNIHFLSNTTGESALTFTDNPTLIEFTDYNGSTFTPDLTGGAVKPVTGIATSDLSGFTIYPNPNNGKFTLHFNGIKSSVSIKVLNALGVTVYEEKEIDAVVSGTKLLDLSNQPDGVYMITVSGHLQVTSQKIVIRK